MRLLFAENGRPSTSFVGPVLSHAGHAVDVVGRGGTPRKRCNLHPVASPSLISNCPMEARSRLLHRREGGREKVSGERMHDELREQGPVRSDARPFSNENARKLHSS
jgi:hypothetical protein